MPSVRYYNQTAPFWDFIANLESNAGNHPFFSAYNPESRGNHRGANPPGPSPSPQDSSSPPAGHHPEPGHSPHDQPHPPHSPHNNPFGAGFPFGRRQHGGWGGGRGGSRCGSGLGGGPFPGLDGLGNDLDLNKIAEFFASHFNTADNKTDNENKNNGASKDFSPPADIFDTDENYVVHVSLPGAKKEDVGVNWDADKSELSVAGVIYRPGDEEFLKTLALDERQVGVFERKVRLGSRASPAVVDEDGMSAKMEDGVLVVTIPKRDAGYVEVKKVDIE
ncbi:MAG: hypothetical protein LQ341_001247 [Variospora aurantia]|nr:MAG: hypothetical protein LQ341_001247 [Variospora aurantia]